MVNNWKFSGKNVKVYDKELNGYIHYLNNGALSKMQIPKDEKQSLGLFQNYITFQLFLNTTKSFTIEIAVSDSNNNKKRLLFSACSKEFAINQLHCRIPIINFPLGVWVNLSIDILCFINECFKGQSFRSVDFICLSADCKIRRVCAMRQIYTDIIEQFVSDKNDFLLPKNFVLPSNVESVSLNLDKEYLANNCFGKNMKEFVPRTSQGKRGTRGIFANFGGYNNNNTGGNNNKKAIINNKHNSNNNNNKQNTNSNRCKSLGKQVVKKDNRKNTFRHNSNGVLKVYGDIREKLESKEGKKINAYSKDSKFIRKNTYNLSNNYKTTKNLTYVYDENGRRVLKNTTNNINKTNKNNNNNNNNINKALKSPETPEITKKLFKGTYSEITTNDNKKPQLKNDGKNIFRDSSSGGENVKNTTITTIKEVNDIKVNNESLHYDEEISDFNGKNLKVKKKLSEPNPKLFNTFNIYDLEFANTHSNLNTNNNVLIHNGSIAEIVDNNSDNNTLLRMDELGNNKIIYLDKETNVGDNVNNNSKELDSLLSDNLLENNERPYTPPLSKMVPVVASERSSNVLPANLETNITNNNDNNITKINESLVQNHYKDLIYDQEKGRYFNKKTNVYYDIK